MNRRKDSDKETLVEEDDNENSINFSLQSEDVERSQPTLSLPESPHNVSSSSLSLAGSSDLPYHSGNTGRSNNEEDVFNRELFSSQETASGPPEVPRETWEINYREAAIFLEEGKNNDKFLHHPRDREALPAYLLVHSQWFNIIDLCVSLVILLLGFVEQDSGTEQIPFLKVPIQVHSSIELCGLILMIVQLYLKTRWIGFRSFLKHKRTLIKGVTLSVMIVEAIVVLLRNKNHFRVTRSLRVLFVCDTYYCGGVRRFIRQIFKSLPPIIDMLGLLLFIMLIYSVMGFYMFGPTVTQPGSPYFKTFPLSFINLFVLLTTANYPDVMMPSYNKDSLSVIFFFTYLMICLYFLMNLLLAVVYEAFTAEEAKKFKKLFLHKRLACQHAFKLLVTKENPNNICFVHFSGMLSYFASSSTPMNNLLLFKMLNKGKTGMINLEEFYGIYDAVEYKWKPKREPKQYYEDCKYPFSLISGAIHLLIKSLAFTYTIYAVIFLNGVLLVIQTNTLDSKNGSQQIYSEWVSITFICIYMAEIFLKLIGLGVRKYFRSSWNIFDCVCTVAGLVSLVLLEFGIHSYYIMILRTLRLLRLFKMKKRFRDVFGTFVILLPRLNSAIIIIFLIYYFFGVIGVEVFSDYTNDLVNCCKNTTVESFFDNNTFSYYYRNNFDNLPRAYVTLFELMVVNNWHVIMEGYATVTGTEFSRIFFMTFYLFTMVVVTIIVAFILEAFLFRIEYKRKMNKDEEIRVLSEMIFLSREEIFFLDGVYEQMGKTGFKDYALESNEETGLDFEGVKRRTKEELQKMMYKEKMVEWLEEVRREEELRRFDFQHTVLSTNTGDSSDESLHVVRDNRSDDVLTIRRLTMNQPSNPNITI